jgi:uncharacterized membrane protein YbaN (DUF454 family)
VYRYDSAVHHDDVTQIPSPRCPVTAGAVSGRLDTADRGKSASRAAVRCVSKWPRSPKRVALALAGIVCVGLAFVGAIVPGLPTTIFLIVASYLFTRSCPWLEDRLIRVRWFRPYLPYLDGSRPMPRRARWAATGAMWVAVSVSLVVTAAADRLALWFAAALVSAATIGTVVIFRIRREPLSVAVAEEDLPRRQ